MNLLKIAFVISITLLFNQSIIGQEWVSYQSQQQINDLVETDNELLMATDAGLVVMNKTTLEKTIFNKSNSNISNNHIQSITQTADGTNWIGTYDVILYRFDGTDFQDMTMLEGVDFNPNTTHLYDLEIAPNGDMWVGTSKALFQKSNNSWTRYDNDDLGPSFFEAWDVEIDDEGNVFMASFDLHKFSNGTWSNLTEDIEFNGYLHADLFFSSTGDLYFAGDLDNIGRFDGTEWETYAHGLNGSQIKTITEDAEGTMYFQSQYNGIFKIENNMWTQHTNAQTIANGDNVSHFYIDDENNHWLNRNIHLSVDKNGTISETLISSTTIERNGIDGIIIGDSGKRYFITGSEEHISVLEANGTWSFLPKPVGVNISFFNDLLEVAVDDLYAATSEGLFHFDGTDWTLLEMGNGNAIVMDSQGKIYIRSFDRMLMLVDGVFSEYNASNSQLSSLNISGHGVDTNDNLWIAAFDWDGNNAIQMVTPDGDWTTYDGADYPVIKRPVGDFHFDVNGNVWFPDDLVGATKFDGTTFTNPIQENISDLENYNAFSIESDAEGKIYFAHQYGVTTLLDGVWEELLIEDVPNSNTSQSSMITFDDEGTLWWGHQTEGVFAYSTNITNVNNPTLEAATKFSLYPNPAYDYTAIDFDLSESANVSVVIYNQLGQLQSNIDLGNLQKGTYQEILNLTDLSKGIYILQFQVNDQFSVKRIIIQ